MCGAVARHVHTVVPPSADIQWRRRRACGGAAGGPDFRGGTGARWQSRGQGAVQVQVDGPAGRRSIGKRRRRRLGRETGSRCRPRAREPTRLGCGIYAVRRVNRRRPRAPRDPRARHARNARQPPHWASTRAPGAAGAGNRGARRRRGGAGVHIQHPGPRGRAAARPACKARPRTGLRHSSPSHHAHARPSSCRRRRSQQVSAWQQHGRAVQRLRVSARLSGGPGRRGGGRVRQRQFAGRGAAPRSCPGPVRARTCPRGCGRTSCSLWH